MKSLLAHGSVWYKSLPLTLSLSLASTAPHTALHTLYNLLYMWCMYCGVLMSDVLSFACLHMYSLFFLCHLFFHCQVSKADKGDKSKCDDAHVLLASPACMPWSLRYNPAFCLHCEGRGREGRGFHKRGTPGFHSLSKTLTSYLFMMKMIPYKFSPFDTWIFRLDSFPLTPESSD